MDVRCDRCETEYELDDAIVTDAGASVQCTTCGHTFVVTRALSSPFSQMGFTPPGGISDPVGPEVPEWTLGTDDGKVHRFRDLNTLQKWIVERKVTRTERICRSGGPWLSLGDVVELAPFFSVVDEADQARSATRISGVTGFPPAFPPAPTSGATGFPPAFPPAPGMVGVGATRGASGPIRTMPAATPPPVPAEGRRSVSEDGPTVPNRRLLGATDSGSIPQPGLRASEPRIPATRGPDARPFGASPAATSPGTIGRQTPAIGRPPARTEIVFGPNITTETRTLESDFLQPSNRGRNLALGLIVLALAAGSGGYWWWTLKQSRTPSIEPTVATETNRATGANTEVPVASDKTAVLPRVQARDSAGDAGGTGTATVPTGSTVADVNPGKGIEMAAGVGGRGVTGTDHSGGTPALAVRGATGANGPANVAAAGGKGPIPAVLIRSARGSADAVGGKNGSYEKLVAEGDRLLERGKSLKADKLYTQALAARPDGVAALTGSAYVLLDRQRHFKAIETFRRALAVQPTFGPALFGIAESYRARGDGTQALVAYRQYLAAAPSGADAPAARRQIKDLESAASAAPSNEQSAAKSNDDSP